MMHKWEDDDKPRKKSDLHTLIDIFKASNVSFNHYSVAEGVEDSVLAIEVSTYEGGVGVLFNFSPTGKLLSIDSDN